jgi:transcriptional regulator with XRE-family HTH domain
MAELRIKEILKERNMTSKSLAESMGKAPQYISNVINGGKGVSINSLEEIAKHLEVPISSLFADYDRSNGASGHIV